MYGAIHDYKYKFKSLTDLDSERWEEIGFWSQMIINATSITRFAKSRREIAKQSDLFLDHISINAHLSLREPGKGEETSNTCTFAKRRARSGIKAKRGEWGKEKKREAT